MLSVLLLGLLLGMRHALDGDHLAAVAALAANSGKAPRIVRLGALWALGHSITLVVLGTIILCANGVVPPGLAGLLECLIGFLLIALGVGVVRQVVAGRVHIHVHHDGGELHLHAHSHAPSDRESSCHDHRHAAALSRRAVLVGVAHGLAGSAGLVLLTLAAIDSVWVGIGYIMIFGLGTVVGMGLLSCIIALPLQLLVARSTFHYKCLMVLVGLWSVILGGVMFYENVGG